MARPVRALLMTSNGTGMGHLSRMLSIALAAGASLDPTVFSLSVAMPVVAGHGLVGEYCPSTERRFMPDHLWHPYLRRRLVALTREVDADVVVFDGVAPYPGLIAARGELPGVATVWIRRGMWRPGRNDRQLAKGRHFDLVVEPGDLAAAADRGPTASAQDAVRVPPITLFDVVDRLDRPGAAAELGLDPDRPTALVTLGSGMLGDVATPGRVAVETLLADPTWQVCVTRSSVAALSVPVVDPGRVLELRGVYPLARYLAAFDLAVSAAGYNAVHELVLAAVPTLFAPNRDTQTDDQVARAEWLAGAGLARSAPADDSGRVAAEVRRLMDVETRRALVAAIDDLPDGSRHGGAAAAARLVVGAGRAGPGPKTLPVRADRALTAARETVKRVIGPEATDRLRRALGRRSGGIPRRLRVRVVEGVGSAPPPDGVRDLVLAESIPHELIATGPLVEHLLPGSSTRYRSERLGIVADAYEVVPG